ncbi:CLUMA_CG005961, isoform A [Clunio marinus]|uniref:CLUMA_CG005961, isoform A n=1 Tax=Clunio marinus TaxID=568069 RepID=A0A1J1HWC1_9DIPT|nr:CLUMA_CG005961, isoform A [Clunio marinus]
MEESGSNLKQEVWNDTLKTKGRKFKSHIASLLDLFGSLIKTSVDGYELCTHITVPKEYVSLRGEISAEWLKEYHVVNWIDFSFKCQHCDLTIKSLNLYWKHLKDNEVEKIKIKCCEEDCNKQYSALNSYINHAIKIHHECLAYSCFICGRIYYSIGFLIQHYADEHPTVRDIYPCIECGYYAQSFTQLKSHFHTHKSSESSDSSDDEPSQKKKKLFSKYGKNDDSRMKDRKHGKTYACPKCNRVLLTKQGWDYHQLVHANSKPFACNICDASFRSKQTCDEHHKACHS